MFARISWICLVFACGESLDRPPADAGLSDSDLPDACASPDCAPWTPPSSAPCDRVAAGPPGRSPIVDLARAHAEVRFFGAGHESYRPVDEALAVATGTSDVVAAYADALEDVCALDATHASLGPAEVEARDRIARVRPGTGGVVIPDEAEVVVLDFRDLPNVPELEGALRAAIEAVLAADLELGALRVRTHFGLVDEVWVPRLGLEPLYAIELETLAAERWPGRATRERDVVVITSERLAPLAARVAAVLRAGGRAELAGAGVRADAAEMYWAPVAERGIAYRGADLLLDGVRLPDEIAPDHETNDAWRAGAAAGPPAPLDRTDGTRSRVVAFDPTADHASPAVDAPRARAALLVARGAIAHFYPYEETVGANLDARLVEVYESIGPELDSAGLERALEHLTAPLDDGHRFLIGGPGRSGLLPVLIDHVGETPYVAASLDPMVPVGLRVESVAGVSASDFYAAEAPYVSASTHENRIAQLGSRLITRDAAVEVRGTDPRGEPWARTIAPRAFDDSYRDLIVRASGDASGWIEGADRIYYINLDGESASTFPGNAALIEHVNAARGARAIIADMRAYPGLPDHFEAHCLLSGGAAMSPIYRVPIRRGPRVAERDEVQWLCAASGRPLDVPLVVLVGPSTQSAAENTAQVLRMARRVRVVGRPTSGSNGNITGLELPGGISLTFTGMEVQNQDGSAFHHVGVPVDEVVPRTAADFATGADPDLRAALALIEREGW